MRRALLVAVVIALAGACGAEQDPGVPPSAGGGAPSTTSRLLEPCPPGGPDATTPSAGCLGPDGAVIPG